MRIFNNHKILFATALGLYVLLSLAVAVMPAIGIQNHNGPLPTSKPLTDLEMDGKAVYIAEGCTACHTQQVRNLEMDKVWGTRPGVAADYARITRTDFWRNTATLMGSERTGPDLTNVGIRQPSREWNLLHLFNPRIVNKSSVMPSYDWLFQVEEYPGAGNVVIEVPEEFRNGISGKIVASPEALQLVAYLNSLKQIALPDGKPVPDFLNISNKVKAPVSAAVGENKIRVKPEFDGVVLYATNCQSCHQENGEGLPGAFPPLKNSKVVSNEDPEVQITIIMKGYNGRVSEGYGIMPAVGTNNNLKPQEVAAIVNHERSSWGNHGKRVSIDQVKKIMESINSIGKYKSKTEISK